MPSMEQKTVQKTHNPQMDSPNNNSNNNNYSSEKIDSNISDIKTVTLSSSNSYSKSPSFSKLLEGVIMAANSSKSHDTLVKTVAFEDTSGMSHQEVQKNIASKATQKGNSINSDEPPGDVPRTPKSDGYSWRKYGQKQVKGSGSSRSYYRCTFLSCYAKKKVQHLDLSGEVIDVEYKGDHNHDPPQNLRVTSRKKDLTPRALHDSSDSVLPSLDASRSLAYEGELKKPALLIHECEDKNPNNGVIISPKDVTEQHSKTVETVISPKDVTEQHRKTVETFISPKDVTEQHSKTVETVSRPESELAIVPRVEEQSESRSDNSNEHAMIDPMKVLGVAPLKKRRIKEKAKACSEPVYRTFKDPKVVVLADSDVGLSSDGYRWRKYGQKMVKGTPHPRSYYRCSSIGCPVRKHVERATDNSAKFIVTYEGEHDHDLPTPKRPHNELSLPNAVSSDTNTKSLSQIPTKDESSNVEEDKKGSENGGGGGDNKALESAQALLSIGIELKSC